MAEGCTARQKERCEIVRHVGARYPLVEIVCPALHDDSLRLESVTLIVSADFIFVVARKLPLEHIARVALFY